MTTDKYILLATLLIALAYGFKYALELQEGTKAVRARVAEKNKGVRA